METDPKKKASHHLDGLEEKHDAHTKLNFYHFHILLCTNFYSNTSNAFKVSKQLNQYPIHLAVWLEPAWTLGKYSTAEEGISVG